MKAFFYVLLFLPLSAVADQFTHNVNLALEYGVVQTPAYEGATTTGDIEEGYARYGLGYRYAFNNNWALEIRFLQGFNMSLLISDAAMETSLVQAGVEYKFPVSDLNRIVIKGGVNQYLLDDKAKAKWEENGWKNNGTGVYIAAGLRTEFRSNLTLSWLLSYDKYEPSDNLGLSVRFGYNF